MNALDQAFIRAFAKGRDSAATKAVAKLPQPVEQPPLKGVESGALVLSDLASTGAILRVDRPMNSTAGLSAAVPHMTVPVVEQVESYQVEDVQTGGPSQVIFQDHLVSLDEPDHAKAESVTSQAEITTITIEPEVDEPTESEPEADETLETEPNVEERGMRTWTRMSRRWLRQRRPVNRSLKWSRSRTGRRPTRHQHRIPIER